MRELRIRINHIQFLQITEVVIKKKVNCHSEAKICGLLDEENIESCRETLFKENSWFGVDAIGEQGDVCPIFIGILKEYSLDYKECIYYLSLDLVSGTYLMDQQKHTRVFQEQDKTYKYIHQVMLNTYFNGGILYDAQSEKEEPCLLVQYQETDWEFAKRLAARCGRCLIPETSTRGVRYYAKIPMKETVKLPESQEYEMQNKTLSPYSDSRNYVYKYRSREIHDLGDRILFKNRKFYICQVESRYLSGELIHDYYFVQEGIFAAYELFPKRIAGISMMGTVKAVKEDKVCIEIEEDEYKTKELRWFPYSTVYSSPDGTGWYCMPEVGDQVRLHFPNENEEYAYVISAVHVHTEDDRVNPDCKSFKNKYKKEIRFTPEKILLTNNSGSFIEISDEDGIRIQSNKGMKICSKEQITIYSEEGSVTLDASEFLRLQQKETMIKLNDDIILSGGELRFQ